MVCPKLQSKASFYMEKSVLLHLAEWSAQGHTSEMKKEENKSQLLAGFKLTPSWSWAPCYSQCQASYLLLQISSPTHHLLPRQLLKMSAFLRPIIPSRTSQSQFSLWSFLGFVSPWPGAINEIYASLKFKRCYWFGWSHVTALKGLNLSIA